MAEPNAAAAPAIHTNIESGNFDEKAGYAEKPPATKPKGEEAEEEDEEGDDQEPLAANPNVASGKQRSLASLNAPRELTRRERYG